MCLVRLVSGKATERESSVSRYEWHGKRFFAQRAPGKKGEIYELGTTPEERALCIIRGYGGVLIPTKDKRPQQKWKSGKAVSTKGALYWHRKGSIMAVVPGSVGLMVVDVDKPEYISSAIQEFGSPIEVVQTPRGWHYLYKATEQRDRKIYCGATGEHYGELKVSGYAVMRDYAKFAKVVGE